MLDPVIHLFVLILWAGAVITPILEKKQVSGRMAEMIDIFPVIHLLMESAPLVKGTHLAAPPVPISHPQIPRFPRNWL